MNALLTLLEVLERSALSVSLRGSAWVYPLINALHIVGIALLVGAILILDWRLLRGRVTPTVSVSVSVLADVLLPAARMGWVLAVLTGSLLFVTRPLDYAFSAVFQLKLGILALALLNVALLHRSRSWQVAVTQNRIDGRVWLACGLSLVSWLLVLGLGRLVGYR